MMKNIFVVLFLFTSASAFSQAGYIKPGSLGWPPSGWDNTEWNLVLNPLTGKGKWANPGVGSDSIINEMDTLCFIVMGDTTCVELDSIYFTDSTACFIQLGDTTCIEYSTNQGNIYTVSGAIVPNGDLRIVTVQNASSLTFRRQEISGVMSECLKIPLASTGNGAVTMQLNHSSSIIPILSMTNPNSSGGLYQHFNGFGTDEDYTFGVNKTLNAFVFAEGTDIGAGGGTGVPYLIYHGGGDSLVVKKDIQLDALVLDEDGDAGSIGNILQKTATGVNWTSGSGLYTASNGLTLTGSNFTWGGTLTGTTTITCSSNPITINGSGTNLPLTISATTGRPLTLTSSNTSSITQWTKTTPTTGSIEDHLLMRTFSSGTTTTGFGGRLTHNLECAGGASAVGSILETMFTTNPSCGSEVSALNIYVNNLGAETKRQGIEGKAGVKAFGRNQNAMGATVGSANDLTLGLDGNVFHISGTTQINAITTTDWQAGAEITLIFDSTPLVKNNTSGGAGTAVMLLAGGLDFAATANDVLKLVYDGTSWFQVSRSAN